MIKTQIGKVIPLEVVIVTGNYHNGNLKVGVRYLIEDEYDEDNMITSNVIPCKANEAFIDTREHKQIYDFLKANGYLEDVGYFCTRFSEYVRVAFTPKFFKEVSA